MADRVLLQDITSRVQHEELYGQRDGSNKYFYLNHSYPADTDFDSTASAHTIDNTDIDIYFWTDAADLSTATLQTSGYTVDPYTGMVTFTTAPTATEAAKITATYSYYRKKPDIALIIHAANVLACAFYAAYEWDLLPSNYRLGVLDISLRPGDSPYLRLKQRYRDIILSIKGSEMHTTPRWEMPEADDDWRKYKLAAREELD